PREEPLPPARAGARFGDRRPRRWQAGSASASQPSSDREIGPRSWNPAPSSLAQSGTSGEATRADQALFEVARSRPGGRPREEAPPPAQAGARTGDRRPRS